MRALLICLLIVGQARADVLVRRHGVLWARISEDGAVRIAGRQVATLRGGVVRVGGARLGDIDARGVIRRRGVAVARLEADGTLRARGAAVARLEPGGVIRRRGIAWARATPADRRAVLVLVLLGW